MYDLKLIKKHYGEKMMHFCRETFPTILEKEGKLFEIISNTFAYNKFLYDDIIDNDFTEDFKNLIYSKYDDIKEEEKKEIVKSPQELLDEAGYILYECKTEKDIQKFKKYYAPKEELCTFRGNRLDSCHVFFAVKKNVDEIKREDYKGKEKRQDEYGTSVISIQFSRGISNTLSIKNRYNHTVANPDATFSNNLDNIIEGLTISFEKHYDLHINANKIKRDLPGYVIAKDEKYYKYNLEIDNTYYCPNNIIIKNFEPKAIDSSRYILFDRYILDMHEKRLYPYREPAYTCRSEYIFDEFVETIGKIKKIEVLKKDKTKEITINDDIIITLNDKNELIKYKNHNLRTIKDSFLNKNHALEEIDIPNVETIGNYFLENNKKLKKISLPVLKTVGNYFLLTNKVLEEAYFPMLETINESFLAGNIKLKEIDLPNAKQIKSNFIQSNALIERISLPQAEKIGDSFLYCNRSLRELSLPNVIKVGTSFIFNNLVLSKINLPKLETMGSIFLFHNLYLEEIDLPELRIMREDTLTQNEKLKRINVPKLQKIGLNSLNCTKYLEELELPEVIEIGDHVLTQNISLKKLYAPKVKTIGANFLYYNNALKELILPKTEKIYYGMLRCNKVLKNIELPAIKDIASSRVYTILLLMKIRNIILGIPKAIAKDTYQLVKRG